MEMGPVADCFTSTCAFGIPDDWRRAVSDTEMAVEKLQEVPTSDLVA
jgi:hypothetical protein